MKKVAFVFISILTVAANSFAQESSYIHRGSIGSERVEAAGASNAPFSALKLISWVGQRFIFIPMPKEQQRYGYTDFFDPKLKTLDTPVGIDYDGYVGKIAKVLSVSNVRSETWDIEFELEGNGERLKARTAIGYVQGLALVSDIDNARAKYLGKTLWHVNRGLSTYDEKTGKGGAIPVKRFAPVKVVDIVVGSSVDSPVRFIVQTVSGEEGYTDVSMSGTNISASMREITGFESSFLTEDPRRTHNWSDSVWAAIENRKVFVGMTAEQALMSWGKPKDINRTTTAAGASEQWVYYDGNYLYVTNGMLTGIQN